MTKVTARKAFIVSIWIQWIICSVFFFGSGGLYAAMLSIQFFPIVFLITAFVGVSLRDAGRKFSCRVNTNK
jgi:hypothetical protein